MLMQKRPLLLHPRTEYKKLAHFYNGVSILGENFSRTGCQFGVPGGTYQPKKYPSAPPGIGVPFWCTNMAAGNQQKHLEFTLPIKTLFFIRELAHVRINISSNTWNGILLKIKSRDFFSMRQHSYFGVTLCENSEVQIALFSKWNMLQGRKLVPRVIFYLSSN